MIQNYSVREKCFSWKIHGAVWMSSVRARGMAFFAVCAIAVDIFTLSANENWCNFVITVWLLEVWHIRGHKLLTWLSFRFAVPRHLWIILRFVKTAVLSAILITNVAKITIDSNIEFTETDPPIRLMLRKRNKAINKLSMWLCGFTWVHDHLLGSKYPN